MSEEDEAIHPAEEGKSVKSETEHISVLTDDLLSCIVSCCTVKDVVNSSLLSRRWRHLSAPMSSLDFNWFSMFEDGITNYDTWRRDKKDPCPEYTDRFVKAVNQFLQSCKGGSQLQRFRISYCLCKESFDDVDQWVHFALTMGVKELRVELTCDFGFGRLLLAEDLHLHYRLRPWLFSECNVAKLQKLFLRACTVEPIVISQFSSLKLLSISRVHFGQHEVDILLSYCSDLESITLKNCDLPLKLCISNSLHRLKFLAVYCCEGVDEFELSASTLTVFEYAGHMVNFSISDGLPNLRQVYIRLWDRKGVDYVFKQLGKDLPMVKILSIIVDTSWGHCLPKYVTIFSNLKILEFFSPLRNEFDARKMIRILKSCPLLEKLYIARSLVRSRQIIKEMRVPTKSLHMHLKEVQLGGFHLHNGYIEFALYMIEYAVALERMIIDPQQKIYHGSDYWKYEKRQTWDEGEREAVCARLKDCSKNVVIVVK